MTDTKTRTDRWDCSVPMACTATLRGVGGGYVGGHAQSCGADAAFVGVDDTDTIRHFWCHAHVQGWNPLEVAIGKQHAA